MDDHDDHGRDDAGGHEEPEVAPESSGDHPPRRVNPLVLAVSLAVVFAVAATVLAVLLAQQGDDGELDALRDRAGRFGAALVTYDYHDPEAHRDAVLGFATGSFREEYQDAFDQGLAQVITEVQAVSTGYVKDVYLAAVDEERAQAIVVVDIEHEGTSGTNTLYDVYFRLTLVDVDGTWKVDQVTDLNFDTGGASTGPTEGSVTTDTTASATTSVP
jgi:Mce-associated membrane protein